MTYLASTGWHPSVLLLLGTARWGMYPWAIGCGCFVKTGENSMGGEGKMGSNCTLAETGRRAEVGSAGVESKETNPSQLEGSCAFGCEEWQGLRSLTLTLISPIGSGSRTSLTAGNLLTPIIVAPVCHVGVLSPTNECSWTPCCKCDS